MSNELVKVSMNDMERIAEAVARSNMFGMKTKEQALALMCIAQAEGMHPAIAARDYHVIQNRPALKADAMLARFQSAGGSVKWDEYTDTRVSGTFSHPQGGSIAVDWDMKRAKDAGLASRENWQKYPRQMLRARVISEAIRSIFPGVLVGFYTEEEVKDFDSPNGKAKYVNSSSVPHDEPVAAAPNHTNEPSFYTLEDQMGDESIVIERGSKEDKFVKRCLVKLGLESINDLSDDEVSKIINAIIKMEEK